MSETMTPEQAARAFVEASRWQSTLAARTEGLGFLVWALVTPGLIATMGFVGVAGFPWWGQLAAWPPWVIGGLLVTHALWRTARITRPDIEPPSPMSYAARVGVIVALVLVLHFVIQPTSMAWPLGMIGAAWMAVGTLNRRLTSGGRHASLAVGAAIAASAVGLAFAGAPHLAGMAWAAVATGVAPLVAGLYQTYR